MDELLADDGVAADVVREVSMHLVADTQLLYPTILRHLEGGDETAARLRHGDHELEELLARLDAGGLVAVNIDELRSMVRRHIDGQEEVFPALATAIPPAEMARLGDEVSRTIREAPTHPHPHLPDHGPLEPAADAIASTIDHLKDARREREQ